MAPVGDAKDVAKRWEEVLKGADVTMSAADLANLTESLALVTSMDTEATKANLEKMSYDGFDPVFMLRLFYKMSSEKTTLEGEHTLGSWKLAKASNFLSDLKFFAVVFMLRGSAVHKILDKSETDFKGALKQKCGQYGISTTKPSGRKQTIPRTKLTLPRIAATAPHWCLQLLHKQLVEPIIGTKIAGVQADNWAVCHPLFASICPSEYLLPICYEVSRMQDRIVNERKKRSKLADLKKFVDAAFNSKLLSSSIRFKICQDLELFVQEGDKLKPTANLRSILSAARLKWEKLESYPKDTKASATKDDEETTSEEEEESSE